MNEPLQPQPIMKGHSRHLFWPVLAFARLSLLDQVFGGLLRNLIYQRVGISAAGVYMILVALFFFCVWAFALAAYALKTTVKTYRVLFIVLTCFELVNLVGATAYAVGYIELFSRNRWIHSTLSSASMFFYILVSADWIVCLVVFACSKKSTMLLRISAIVLALSRLFLTVYDLAVPSLTVSIVHAIGIQGQIMLSMVMNVVNGSFHLAALLFFFATVSFSKVRGAKAQVVPVGELPLI